MQVTSTRAAQAYHESIPDLRRSMRTAGTAIPTITRSRRIWRGASRTDCNIRVPIPGRAILILRPRRSLPVLSRWTQAGLRTPSICAPKRVCHRSIRGTNSAAMSPMTCHSQRIRGELPRPSHRAGRPTSLWPCEPEFPSTSRADIQGPMVSVAAAAALLRVPAPQTGPAWLLGGRSTPAERLPAAPSPTEFPVRSSLAEVPTA